MSLQSIQTLITDNVVEVLNSVGPPPYPVTLVVYDPVQRKPSSTESNCYVVVGDAERMPDEDTPANWIGWVVTIEVMCVIVQDETSDIPIRTLVSDYAASVEKALLEDVSRGGFAVDTIPKSRLTDYPREGEAWVQSNYEVHYRTAYGDPFNPQ